MSYRQIEVREDHKEVYELVYGNRSAHGHEPRIDTPLSIRAAVSDGDREKLRAMFSRSSSETIHRRFHAPYSEVPETMISLMLGSNRGDTIALLAVAGGDVVGHAMCVREGDGKVAEMAIVIEDGWQAKGAGKLLVRQLAKEAMSRGIETFVGSVLPHNRRMLGLIGSVFSESKTGISDGVFVFRAPLGTLRSEEPSLTYPPAA